MPTPSAEWLEPYDFSSGKAEQATGSLAECSELKEKMHFGDLWPFTLQIKKKILAKEYKSTSFMWWFEVSPDCNHYMLYFGFHLPCD